MPKNLSVHDAKRYLSDCPSEQCFWVNNGPILKNIGELSSALNNISNDQFTHHLNHGKNDFSKWVGEVIGDSDLAAALSKVKTRSTAIKKINGRIETLKKIAC